MITYEFTQEYRYPHISDLSGKSITTIRKYSKQLGIHLKGGKVRKQDLKQLIDTIL